MQSNPATGSDIGLTATNPALLLLGHSLYVEIRPHAGISCAGTSALLFMGSLLSWCLRNRGIFFHNRVYPAHAPLFDRTWGRCSNRSYSSRLHVPGLDQILFLCLPIFLALAFKPPCFLIHKNRHYEHSPESGRRQEKL